MATRWREKVKPSLFLDYDDSVDYGSPQHFFHLMWGYLLPALHHLMTLPGGPPPRVRFLSSGPTMDPVVEEACRLLGVEAVLVESRSDNGPQATALRWETMLLREGATRGSSVCRARLSRRQPTGPLTLSPGAWARLRDDVAAVRARLIAEAMSAGPPDPALAGRILVLKRSAMPAFYAPVGAAETKGYGVGRRALVGIDEAVDVLSQHGVPAAAFEPGAVGLAAQIRAFHSAAGVVGVRGAEWANLLWLRPGRRAFVLTPQAMMRGNPPILQLIAELAQVDLVEEEAPNSTEIAIDPTVVRSAFAGRTPS